MDPPYRLQISYKDICFHYQNIKLLLQQKQINFFNLHFLPFLINNHGFHVLSLISIVYSPFLS